MNNLSKEANKKLDELVKRVAKKAGYNGGELTYQEHLQMKLENTQKKYNDKLQRQKRKFGFDKKNNDFIEEIKTYLAESITELMQQGKTEQEAVKITMEQFDEAELKPDFESFMDEFNDFGIQATTEWYMQKGEAIGLFFAAFTVLGLTLGAIIGYFIENYWLGAVFGAVAGVFIGTGFGLLAQAILVARRK